MRRAVIELVPLLKRVNAHISLIVICTASVVLFSLLPLFVDWSGSDSQSFFAFGAFAALGATLAYVTGICLLLAYNGIVRHHHKTSALTVALVRRTLFRKSTWHYVFLFFGGVRYFSYAMLAYAAAIHDGIILATFFLGTWITFLLVGEEIRPHRFSDGTDNNKERDKRKKNEQKRDNRLGPLGWTFLGLSMAGLLSVLLAQSSSSIEQSIQNLSSELWLLLAIVTAPLLLASGQYCSLEWIEKTRKAIDQEVQEIDELSDAKRSQANSADKIHSSDISEETSEVTSERRRLAHTHLLLSLCWGALVGVIGIVSLGITSFVEGDAFDTPVILYGMLAGVFAIALPTVAWRMSVIVWNNVALTSLQYLVPVFSFIFLLLGSDPQLPNIELLLLGSSIITVANFMIHIKAERRSGYRILVLSLWVFGAFVYLRDKYWSYVVGGGIEWDSHEWVYFEVIGMTATVFALLLSFRLTRLQRRLVHEEGLTVEIMHWFAVLVRRRKLSSTVLGDFVEWDRARDRVESIDKYLRIREKLHLGPKGVHLETGDDGQLTHELTGASDLWDEQEERTRWKEHIRRCELLIDEYLYSRQQGVQFGELFGLYLFGGMAVFVTLLTAPALEGWTRAVSDILAVTLASVIVFLGRSVNEIERERSDKSIFTLEEFRNEADKEPESAEPEESYYIVAREKGGSTTARTLALMVGVALVGVFGFIYYSKWLM